MSTKVVDLTASEPSVSPMPEITLEPTLIEAISDAKIDRLRETLTTICSLSAEATELAKDLLLIPEVAATQRRIEKHHVTEDAESTEDEEETEDEDDEDSEDGNSDSGKKVIDKKKPDAGKATVGYEAAVSLSAGLKRMRPRFATCAHCSEEFDVTTNGVEDCVWHPGQREADYDGDFWADHDEDCHGRIIDLKDTYPEGFRYNCCNRLGDDEGCKYGTHVEKEGKSKRRRF